MRMKINPIAIVGGLLGMTFKCMALLAVALFMYDVWKIRRKKNV